MNGVNRLGYVAISGHNTSGMPVFVWNAVDKALDTDNPWCDVYDIWGEMYLVIMAAQKGHFMIMVAPGAVITSVPMSAEEIDAIPGMPRNWDIPF